MAARAKPKAGRGSTRGGRGIHDARGAAAPRASGAASKSARAGVSAARARGAAPKPAQAAAPAAAVALPRVSKGKRPQFYDSVAVDQLFAIVTALAGELSVVFDRLDTVERLLAANGVLTEDAVEAYQPSDAAAEARGAKREALIQRVFAVFEAYGVPRHR